MVVKIFYRQISIGFDTLQVLKVIILIIIPYLLFALAYYSHYKQQPAWVTRKLIHTFGLFIVGIYGAYLNSLEEVFYVIFVFLTFLAILSVIPKIQLFQSLIRMGTREGERQLESLINTSLTSLSVLILMFVSFLGPRHLFLAGVLSVAFGDGLGEFVGKPYGKHKYSVTSEKSLEGSFGVFIGTLIGCIFAFVSFNLSINSFNVISVFVLASIIATIIEGVSKSFIDNITMPWAVAGILWYFI